MLIFCHYKKIFFMKLVNPFHATVSFDTSWKPKIFWYFQGVSIETSGMNWVFLNGPSIQDRNNWTGIQKTRLTLPIPYITLSWIFIFTLLCGALKRISRLEFLNNFSTCDLNLRSSKSCNEHINLFSVFFLKEAVTAGVL